MVGWNVRHSIGGQKILDFSDQSDGPVGVLCPALPYDQDIPPPLPQLATNLSVTVLVPLPFVLPEFGSGFRHHATIATMMHVPVAAMHKNNLAVPRKDNIGFPGQVAGVEPEPIAHAVNQRANKKLRLCVLALNLGHVVGSLRCGMHIRHDDNA
jgi:hypothetical protein